MSSAFIKLALNMSNLIVRKGTQMKKMISFIHLLFRKMNLQYGK